MTEVQSLAEAEASRRDVNNSEVDEKAYDIRVEDFTVQYLKGDDEWVDLCPLKELPETDIKIAYDELYKDYNNLQNVVESVYDKDKEMWRLEPEYTNGEVTGFQIPLNSSFTDNVTVWETHCYNRQKDQLVVKPCLKSSISKSLDDLETDNLFIDSSNIIHSDVEVEYINRLEYSFKKLVDETGYKLAFPFLLILPQLIPIILFLNNIFGLQVFLVNLMFILLHFVTVMILFNDYNKYNRSRSNEPEVNKEDLIHAILYFTPIGSIIFTYLLFKIIYNTDGLKNVKSNKLHEVDDFK